jgi:hypothetical protein
MTLRAASGMIVSLARARSAGSISNNNELPQCSRLSVATVAQWRSLTDE